MKSGALIINVCILHVFVLHLTFIFEMTITNKEDRFGGWTKLYFDCREMERALTQFQDALYGGQLIASALCIAVNEISFDSCYIFPGINYTISPPPATFKCSSFKGKVNTEVSKQLIYNTQPF